VVAGVGALAQHPVQRDVSCAYVDVATGEPDFEDVLAGEGVFGARVESGCCSVFVLIFVEPAPGRGLEPGSPLVERYCVPDMDHCGSVPQVRQYPGDDPAVGLHGVEQTEECDRWPLARGDVLACVSLGGASGGTDARLRRRLDLGRVRIPGCRTDGGFRRSRGQ
jgi:hypothetical protein